MARTRLMLAAMLLVLAAMVGRASAGEVPPDSVGADTVFVIYADARHLTPDLLRAASFVALGDNAERAKDFIANFTDRYDKAVKAGVDSVTVVGTSSQRVADAGDELAGGDPKVRHPNPPVVYFHLKAGGDAKALEKLMTQDIPEKQRQDAAFEHEDDWVIMHQKTQNPPAKVDADRAREFNDGLATIREAAIGFVIIPDARMKTEMDRTARRDGAPKIAKSALPPLSTSKWIALAVALGNDPGLTLTANTADTKSADQLKDAVDSALEDLKHPAEGAVGPMVFISAMLAPVVDGLKPGVHGNTVTSSLKGDGLKTIANLIATVRAMAPRPAAAPPPAK